MNSQIDARFSPAVDTELCNRRIVHPLTRVTANVRPEIELLLHMQPGAYFIEVAKQIGLTIPQSVLYRADEVIG